MAWHARVERWFSSRLAGCKDNYDFDHVSIAQRRPTGTPKRTHPGVQVRLGCTIAICLIRHSCDEIRLDAACPGAAQLFLLESAPHRPPKRPTEFLQSSPLLFHIS